MAAVLAGHEHAPDAMSAHGPWVPRPEPAEPWSEETQAAYDRLAAEIDSMHRRLMAETPEGA
jgi:hypothetical protein